MTPEEYFHVLFMARPAWTDCPVEFHGSRKTLMREIGELGLTNGAEIGVDRGSFSRYMFSQMPGLHLICVDAWTRRYRGAERIRHTKARLEGCNYELVHKTSLQAAGDVKNRSLDFVYIDGDHHFDQVMLDIIIWSEKVRPGGIVAGHDCWEHGYFGVTEAVGAYTRANDITEWFVTNEMKAPSWFWVKHAD